MATRQRQWVERETSLITTNSSEFGATNVNAGYSKWQGEYPGGITFPANSKNLTLDCPQASLWYSSWLIGETKNTFRWTILASAYGLPLGIVWDIVVPPGLWSLSDLNTYIKAQMQINVNNPIVESFFDIIGQPATGKCQVRFNTAATGDDLRFDFTNLDTSMAELLGFVDAAGAGMMIRNWTALWPAGGYGAPIYTTGGRTAQFDELGSYLLQTSLCGGRGLPVNNIAGNVVAQIIPDVEAGAQILYRPPQPPKIDVQHLAGKTINTIHFQLTSEKGRELTFNSEVSTFLLRFQWLEPLDLL